MNIKQDEKETEIRTFIEQRTKIEKIRTEKTERKRKTAKQ